jgi:hypothetical protein
MAVSIQATIEMATDAEEIPTALASAIYADGRDALARSHVYTKMRWVAETDQYTTFPIPPVKNLFWLQLRLTCSNQKGAMVDICYVPPEGKTGATHFVSFPLQAGHRTWTPLTWALPAASMAEQQLVVCVTLFDRTCESRPEFVRLDLLGFEGLYPWSKELGLGADEKGKELMGYYNYLRPDECVYLPLSGHVDSTGLRVLPPLWAFGCGEPPARGAHLGAWQEEGKFAIEDGKGDTRSDGKGCSTDS